MTGAICATGTGLRKVWHSFDWNTVMCHLTWTCAEKCIIMALNHCVNIKVYLHKLRWHNLRYVCVCYSLLLLGP